MSIEKNMEEMEEEISFGNEEFWGNNVVKWRKLKKKCGSPEKAYNIQHFKKLSSRPRNQNKQKWNKHVNAKWLHQKLFIQLSP